MAVALRLAPWASRGIGAQIPDLKPSKASPVKLHCARHTWATLALRAGKSVRWVADQLGHADPALTLRVYAHAMREEEHDLSFADFGASAGSERPYPAPIPESDDQESPNYANSMARREGFEERGRAIAKARSPVPPSATAVGPRPPGSKPGAQRLGRPAEWPPFRATRPSLPTGLPTGPNRPKQGQPAPRSSPRETNRTKLSQPAR